MGLFNNKAKIREFDDSAKRLMDVFMAANSPDHPSFDELNEAAYLKKFLENSKEWRDLAGRERLYNYASLFSTIHWRTYVKVSTNLIARNHSELFSKINEYGFIELDYLYTDLHYLALGVKQFGVKQVEYDECAIFVLMLKNLLITLIEDRSKKSEEPGFILFRNDSGVRKCSVEKLISSLEPTLNIRVL